MPDTYEFDSVGDIARTEGFEILLSQIDAMALHHERLLIQAAACEPIETIRLMAGRVGGIRLVAARLKMTKEKSRGSI